MRTRLVILALMLSAPLAFSYGWGTWREIDAYHQSAYDCRCDDGTWDIRQENWRSTYTAQVPFPWGDQYSLNAVKVFENNQQIGWAVFGEPEINSLGDYQCPYPEYWGMLEYRGQDLNGNTEVIDILANPTWNHHPKMECGGPMTAAGVMAFTGGEAPPALAGVDISWPTNSQGVAQQQYVRAGLFSLGMLMGVMLCQITLKHARIG